MRIALLQVDLAWEDPPANRARLAPRLAEAAEAGARLVLLPEMFPTGFSMASERLAEPMEGPTVTFLSGQAAALGCHLGGSLACAPADGGRPVNRFVLASPDGTVRHYDKIHPFSHGGEPEHYRAGSDRVTLELEGLRATLFVCYDLRFADRFWEAAEETDCYLLVANWPASRQDHWRTLSIARAIENQAYLAGVNRVGVGDGTEHRGGSLVVGPFGEIVAEAGGSEELLLAEVDPGRVAEVRSRYRFLADR